MRFTQSLFFKLLKPFSLRYFIFLHKKQKNFLNIPVPSFTLSFDCDLERDTFSLPEICEILQKYNFKASFACIGMWLEKYPEIYQRLLDEGHEIINHTYSHPDNIEISMKREFHNLSAAEMEKEIVSFEKVCQAELNYKPIGFRVPHFGKSFTLRIFPVLKKLGYKYDSSTTDFKVNKSGYPYKIDDILEIPLTCFPHLPWALMDTWGAFHCSNSLMAEIFLPEFKLLMRIIKKYNLYLSLYLDPADAIKYNLLEPFCKVLKQNQISIMRYADLF